MKDVALFLACVCAPAILAFSAADPVGTYAYFCMAVIQLALFPLALLYERHWWVAYGLGFGGLFIGSIARIVYDLANRLHGHHLLPIELAIFAVVDVAWVVIGMGVFLLIRRWTKRNGG